MALTVVWVRVLTWVDRSFRACMVVSSMLLARYRNFPVICWRRGFCDEVSGGVSSMVAI